MAEHTSSSSSSSSSSKGRSSKARPPKARPPKAGASSKTRNSSKSRPPGKAVPRPRNGWQLLGATALGLVLAVVLGWFTGVLAGNVFGPDEQNDEAAPSSSAPAAPTSETGGSGEPVEITDATLFDPPPGDGEENPDRIDLSYDGQPGTTWPTLQYQSTAAFGNIKPGVGIVYDLGSETTISQVDIVTTLPGATVEIRSGTGTDGTIDQFPIIAGPVELQTNTTIEIPEGTTTRYVLVWLTELVPQQSYFQAALSEVTIYN